ncbi:thiol:disulfide interchange protein DsbG [Gallaecimonas mangrovi]|uniref:thiol:disulfide interchange protein DsbG n=1 Tax=Gallaecimonas mangrovi TaxID=2291597 RepID=UPI000E20257A|nr:thiol:disulfide interchange protein DsbG [Gallaecimonas mangrovi]
MVFKSASLALLSALFMGQAMAAASSDLPAPVKALTARGLEIVGSFDAPAGLKGFAGTVQGQPVAVYLTADGKHVLVGNLLDAKGKDLTTPALDKIVNGPKNEKAWSHLEDSHWVLDGKADAPRIVYMLDDPECPYCHKFWQQTRPWVEAGKVQIRHVLVGIITKDSPDEAAAIMSAKDPSAALDAHEKGYRGEGRNHMDTSHITKEARAIVDAHNQMMQKLALYATPAVFYKKEDGSVGLLMGAPQGDSLEEIMGSPMPKAK